MHLKMLSLPWCHLGLVLAISITVSGADKLAMRYTNSSTSPPSSMTKLDSSSLTPIVSSTSILMPTSTSRKSTAQPATSISKSSSPEAKTLTSSSEARFSSSTKNASSSIPHTTSNHMITTTPKSNGTSCTKTAAHNTITSCDPNYDPWYDLANFNTTLQHIYYCSTSGYSSIMSILNDYQVSLDVLNVRFNKLVAVDTASETNAALTYSMYSSLYTSRENIISDLWGTNADAVYTLGDAVSDSCQFSVCSNQLQAQKSQWYASNTDIFVYSAKKPCCGYCTVGGAAVQVAYWPTPAPTPHATVLVDKNNSTYYSPSVYATFIDFSSWDDCSIADVYYPSIYGTFADGYLETSQYPTDASQQLTASFEAWTPINFRDFGPQCTCTPPNCASDPLLGWQTNLCTPELSIPTDLLKYIPAWRTCTAQFDGVFDPPIALQPTNGLSTPPTNSHTTPTTSPAAPGSTPTTAGPTATQVHVTPTAEAQSSSIPAFNGNPSTNPAPSTSSTSSSGGLPSVYIPSMRASNPTIIINGQTTISTIEGTFVIGTQTASIDTQGDLIIGTQTVTRNSQGDFIVGTQTASLDLKGDLVIGTQTIPPHLAGSQTPSINPQGDLVIGTQTFTHNSQGNFILGTQTASLDSQGDLIIGTQTITSFAGQIQTPSLNAQGDLVIGTQTVTPDASGDFVLGKETITENGQVVTITGGTISVGTSKSVPLGDIIASFLGVTGTKTDSSSSTASAASTSSLVQYTGAAERMVVRGLAEGGLFAGVVLGIMVWL